MNMKWTKLVVGGCLSVACSTSSLLGQSAPAEIRVRAVADKDGKVQVVEERIIGKEDGPQPKGEGKDEEGGRRLIRRFQEAVTERLAPKAVAEVTEVAENAIVDEFWGEMPHSDYWLGVQIAPVAPEIRKHLPIKHGILIVQVYPDSPALKAELKADDILLEAGSTKIETGPDLVKAVDAAKDTQLSVIVLRGGKETKVDVTPTKRTDTTSTMEIYGKSGHVQREKLTEATKQLEKVIATLRAESDDKAAVDFMLVRPGAFIFRNTAPKMPDDLTIQITKEGNKPAKVHVKKGDKSWDTTADKLDEIPKDIRPHVDQFLSGPTESLSYAAPSAFVNSGTFQMKTAGPQPKTAFYAPYGGGSATYVPAAPAVPATPATPAAPSPPHVRLPSVTQVVPGLPAPGVVTVHPAPPAPGMAPAMARAATVWSQAISPPPMPASDAKLDQILKKLDSLSTPDLEDMKKELKALRKEVDELRSKKN